MKITHINDWDQHTVIIDSEVYDPGSGSRFVVQVNGYGKTKSDAITSGIASIKKLDFELKEMREKLSAL